MDYRQSFIECSDLVIGHVMSFLSQGGRDLQILITLNVSYFVAACRLVMHDCGLWKLDSSCVFHTTRPVFCIRMLFISDISDFCQTKLATTTNKEKFGIAE